MSSQRAPKPVRSYHLIALVLLVAFFAQCAWFVASVPLTQLEADQILRGVALLRHIPLDSRAGLLAAGSVALRSGHCLSSAAESGSARSVLARPASLVHSRALPARRTLPRRSRCGMWRAGSTAPLPATSFWRSLPSAPEWLRARRWPGRRSLPPGEPSASSSPPSPPRTRSMRRARSSSGTGSASSCSASPSPSPSEPSGRWSGCCFRPRPSCCGRFRTAAGRAAHPLRRHRRWRWFCWTSATSPTFARWPHGLAHAGWLGFAPAVTLAASAGAHPGALLL